MRANYNGHFIKTKISRGYVELTRNYRVTDIQIFMLLWYLLYIHLTEGKQILDEGHSVTVFLLCLVNQIDSQVVGKYSSG